MHGSLVCIYVLLNVLVCDFGLQLHKTNEGIDRFRNLISDVIETDRFYTFLETFRKDAEDPYL